MTEVNTGQVFNCIDEDDYSTNSVFSDLNNKKYRMIDIITNNVGRETVSRQVTHSKNISNGEKGVDKIFYKKLTNISFYTTSLTPGFRIRNAVSGSKEPFIVGSKNEDLYFKVSLNTGELSRNTYSNTMFFNSPEEYETHFYTKLSDDIKSNWKFKYNLALNRIRTKKNKERVAIEVK